jgi:signal transduction histidine kinase
MTRRIAISILLTVWLVLIGAGALAYFVTRSFLVADLDETLLARVSSLPGIERPSALLDVTAADTRDRFVIENPQGQQIRPPTGPAHEVPAPKIVSASFSRLANGTRIRTLNLEAFARRNAPADPLVPVKVVYSGSAARLDEMLTRLLLTLGGFGLLAGLGTAGVAVLVARTALRPLRSTAEVIGNISEKNLDSRIVIEKLPTELHPVASRLNELLARLETAFAQRKQFLADASHELRTPVAALVTTLEVTLRKNRPTDEYVRTLASCLTDAQLLHQLVAALMDQVRNEHFHTDAPAELAPVQLSNLLAHCAKIATALATPRNIQVITSIPESITALTDELKLRSIVTNLLSNAVEYTPNSGRVTLTLDLLDAKRQRNTIQDLPTTPRLLRITIADTGPGIAPEDLTHLFQPFYRADKARTNPERHLGLGLFLVQSHAESLGGQCHVKSTLGHGATFIVELPTEIVNNAEANHALDLAIAP